MCLAIPGKVLTIRSENGLQIASIAFGGVTRDACLDYLPEAQVGDYVLVHVGFAISKVDEDEAQRTYQALVELGEIGELDVPAPKERLA